MPRVDHPSRFFRPDTAPERGITAAMVGEFARAKEAGIVPPLPKPPALKPIPSLAQAVKTAPAIEVGATPALKAIHTSAEATSRTQARVNGPARADLSASRGAGTNK